MKSSLLTCLRPAATEKGGINKHGRRAREWNKTARKLPHTSYGSASIVTESIGPPSDRKQRGKRQHVYYKNTSHANNTHMHHGKGDVSKGINNTPVFSMPLSDVCTLLPGALGLDSPSAGLRLKSHKRLKASTIN